MRKISQQDLARRQAEGATVKHRAAPKAKRSEAKEVPVETKKKKDTVAMASMAASMQHLDNQARATREVIDHNSKVIEGFRKDLSVAVQKVDRKVPYAFDVERGEDKLITRIVATPQEN